TDAVTEMDRRSESLIVEHLLNRRGDDGVLGEEGGERRGSSGVRWVIDPLDGTVNYLYGLPVYAVSIAATVSGTAAPAASAAPAAPGTMADGRRAIAGAVYLPALDELYTASEGGGAQLNGTPLAGPAETTLASALVATGFGYTVERRTEQAEVVRRLIPRVRDIRRIGSAAADLCFLAAGRLDAYYERGLQPWDYAAGALIARESGALLLGRGDDAPGEPMLIAAAPRLARVLHTEIEAAYAAG
ncbi:MAG: inositol monophosphatase, partial [Leucobacter sp.]|nr:inositol monophosphatase [Leucobacter sp.]